VYYLFSIIYVSSSVVPFFLVKRTFGLGIDIKLFFLLKRIFNLGFHIIKFNWSFVSGGFELNFLISNFFSDFNIIFQIEESFDLIQKMGSVSCTYYKLCNARDYIIVRFYNT
jgi:hypothetical protein